MPAKPRTSLPPSILAKLELGETESRPLGDVNTAMRDLNLDSDEVRMLVQLGYLVAFNIACPRRSAPSGACPRRAKAELRVLTRSIEEYRSRRTKHVCKLPWRQIFKLILPQSKLALKGTEIQRALNCDHGHVKNLIATRHLVALDKPRPGPGGSWIICRASLEKFLKSRLQ
jgi:hypothetical protein